MRDRSILVTGATGSFGRRFINRILHDNPRRLVGYSRDEQKQDAMEKEISHPSLRLFLGDVRDQARLEMAMRDIEIVIHCAALKIIPKCESDPIECVSTNVGGAENLIRASIRTGVKQVIALSTDKACNPINLYGATKLAAEKLFVAAKSLAGQNGPKFSVIRWGNVLGSRGSVIPFFQSCIERGDKELPITDTRMSRYWISLDQAVEFTLSSIQIARGGDIFIPKIPSMNIVDLARAMAPHLPHKIVGIRPGEKLAETLLTEDEARMACDLGDRYIISRDGPLFTGGKPVPEGFRYSSDRNDQWLTIEEMRDAVKQLQMYR